MKYILSLGLFLILPFSTAFAQFADVDQRHDYFRAISYVQERGIVSGYEDGSFGPDRRINRAEFLKIIVEATFDSKDTELCIKRNKGVDWKFIYLKDVPLDSWFGPYVCMGIEHGLVSGYEDGNYRPGSDISFVEAAKIISNGFKFKAKEFETIWYRGFVDELGDRDAIPLSIDRFDSKITRGEMAEIIFRLQNTGSFTSQNYSLLSGKPLSRPRIVVRNIPLASDFTHAKVEKDSLIQGCFGGQDCIESIDAPRFESVADADQWMDDSDLVFGIEHKGVARAYSARILNWHEIVNDTIAGDPIAISFCPLCGSSVAFERIVNGTETEFGVSGFLHNNDLVMFDRFEGNLWQQITAEAIVGPAAKRNEILKRIPISTVTWKEWKQAHPESMALARNPALLGRYDISPYGDYSTNSEILFPMGVDTRMHIKTIVQGINVAGVSKAYPDIAFDSNSVIRDTIGGRTIEIKRSSSGHIEAIDLNTGEEIIVSRLFWFAWASFHPDTLIYQ